MHCKIYHTVNRLRSFLSSCHLVIWSFDHSVIWLLELEECKIGCFFNTAKRSLTKVDSEKKVVGVIWFCKEWPISNTSGHCWSPPWVGWRSSRWKMQNSRRMIWNYSRIVENHIHLGRPTDLHITHLLPDICIWVFSILELPKHHFPVWPGLSGGGWGLEAVCCYVAVACSQNMRSPRVDMSHGWHRRLAWRHYANQP